MTADQIQTIFISELNALNSENARLNPEVLAEMQLDAVIEDSIEFLTFIMNVEDKLGIEIDSSFDPTNCSVRDAAQLLFERLSNSKSN